MKISIVKFVASTLGIRHQSKRLLHVSKRWASKQMYVEKDEECENRVKHMQRNSLLPKLPVPKLEDTMKTYLELAEVVVASEQQMNHTRKIVRDFLDGQGPILQQILLERQNNYDNWITQWWQEDMYLKRREPLPVNFTACVTISRRHITNKYELAHMGALFIDELLDYKNMLDRGELPVDYDNGSNKGQPLCMQQFYQQLGASRIPEVGKDRIEIQKRSDDVQQEELVIVACKNYFYPIWMKTADCPRRTLDEIQAQLLQCINDAAAAPPAPKIGLLTSLNRDYWANIRKLLTKDENNRKNLELISQAVFVLCLDESFEHANLSPETNDALDVLLGGGVNYNSANRWFDQAVQVVVSNNGAAGVCMEHSLAEAIASFKICEVLLARAEKRPSSVSQSVSLPAAQAMLWTVTPEVQDAMNTAERDLDLAINDFDLKLYHYDGYGFEFIKNNRVSPDAFVQLALQLAYYKMYGHVVSTYESASIRRFRGGRVDNIRSAHGAALSWVKFMCSSETPISEEPNKKQMQQQLFRQAAQKQTSIMKATVHGCGIDNHLVGLREAALENMRELPELFTDPTYEQMMEFKLSTSKVVNPSGQILGCYGPVVPDGYGCCYSLKKDAIIFITTSFFSSKVTDSEAFSQAIKDALDSMKLIMT